ncbi:MAG: glycoside hydrolase family 18 protein [Bacteroidales bacterium]|jgi:chitinase|nr:glycoside hydrolase family 18 protein [Bacteroidales bacterium]
MKNSCSILLSLLFAILTSCGSPSEEKDFMVVGYVAGFRGFDVSKIDAARLTHVNYAFANIINGRVMFDTTRIDDTEMNIDDIRKLNSLKEVNPYLKVLVSVGGWGWSGNFSDAALTDSSRNRFAESTVDFIISTGVDGVDLDWEYPNQAGAGNIHRPEDIDNFTLLLKAVREHIDSLAWKQGRKEPYLLTIATGGDSAYIANTRLGEASQYLDFINIMSYDLHNGLTSQTGHHSNLLLSEWDSPHGDATERSVRMHLEAGVSPSKLNIGVPFYGRIWRGTEPVNNGLYREARTTGQSISNADIIKIIADTAFVRIYDSSACSPFLWNERDSVFISYDDDISLAEKMKWVKANGLAGVMFWEYAEDPEGKLLNIIVSGLRSEKSD